MTPPATAGTGPTTAANAARRCGRRPAPAPNLSETGGLAPIESWLAFFPDENFQRGGQALG